MGGKSRPERTGSAFDELRFGASAILDLHEGLPGVAEAVDRCEKFLRQHQVRGTAEALVITGRGTHSPEGDGAIRAAVEKLLFSLRRRGVIASHEIYNPGAFVVRPASIRSLVEALPRRREPPSRKSRIEFKGLEPETVRLLRELAEASLASLGVVPDDATVADEMHKQLGAIVSGMPGGADMEARLRDALRAATAEYD